MGARRRPALAAAGAAAGALWCIALGVAWSHVQWLVAALSVGLGFGLQEIFANFVSGMILLFERPIRVGDVVTIGDVSGVVTRIRMRATTVVPCSTPLPGPSSMRSATPATGATTMYR